MRAALGTLNTSIMAHVPVAVPPLWILAANAVMAILQTARVELRAVPVPAEIKQYMSRAGKICPVCSRTFYGKPWPMLVLRGPAADAATCKLVRLPVCSRACVLDPSAGFNSNGGTNNTINDAYVSPTR